MTLHGMHDLYHTGLVVNDLQEAMRTMTAAVGAQWAEPVHATLPVRTPHGIVERESWVTFSTGEPHHIELIEAVWGGVWVPDDGGPRLHHLGFWVDDLQAESARLEGLGLPLRVTGVGGEGAISFAYHDAGQGALFLELNSRSKRTQLYEWLERGSNDDDATH